MSSLRLFKVAMSGLDITKNLSVMHKLHCLVRLVYAVAFARIFHVTAKTSFLFINFEKYLLSSVSFFLRSCLNYFGWFLHLVLNSVAVRPINVSVVSLVVTLRLGTQFLFASIHSVACTHLFFCTCTFLWFCFAAWGCSVFFKMFLL